MLSLQQLCCLTADAAQQRSTVAIHRQQAFSYEQFVHAVAAHVKRLQQWPEKQRWVLFCEDALPFAIGFFAPLSGWRTMLGTENGNITPPSRPQG